MRQLSLSRGIGGFGDDEQRTGQRFRVCRIGPGGDDQFAKLLHAAFLQLLRLVGQCLQFRIKVTRFTHRKSPLRVDAPMIISSSFHCCRVVETV